MACLFVVDRVVLHLQPITGLYRYDDATDFVMKPNVRFDFVTDEYAIEIATNGIGMRDDEPTVASDRKILLLGDSIAFGYGVEHEDTFGYLFEQGLKRKFGGRYEVLNAGHSGYDTRRQYEYLRLMAGQLSQSAIIVTFFINDPLSNSGEFFFSPVPTGWLRHVPGDGLAALLNYATKYPGKLLFKLGFNDSYREVEHFDCLRPGLCEEGWTATEQYLAKIGQFARERNTPVILVNAPAREQLKRDSKLPTYDRQLASQKLAAFARRHGLYFVDLAENTALTADLYFPKDRHWTPAGHRAVADYLLEAAIRSGVWGLEQGNGR